MRYDLETPAVWSALSEFGLDLLKTARQEGEGTLLSPLSAALALSMAANGADGRPWTSSGRCWGRCQPGGPQRLLLCPHETLWRTGGLHGVSIANSLWTDPEGRMQEDFVGRCSGIFDAQVFQEDLSAPVIVPALNSWVSDHTAGMIPQIIQRPLRGGRRRPDGQCPLPEEHLGDQIRPQRHRYTGLHPGRRNCGAPGLPPALLPLSDLSPKRQRRRRPPPL